MSTNTKETEIHSVKIQDTSCQFGFEMLLNSLEKEVLFELPNPKF